MSLNVNVSSEFNKLFQNIFFVVDFFKNMKLANLYLDYAATTPVDRRVVAAMRPYFSDVFANAGALHWQGQRASAAVFKSRQTIAQAIGAHYQEIIFTGSATEANNLVLRGVVKSVRYQVPAIKRPRIVVSTIEHESILETCRDLAAPILGASLAQHGREQEGVEVVYIPVNRDGIVDLEKLAAALNGRTILISIMYVNNEVGMIQPISKISEIVRNFREVKSQRSNVKSSEAVYPLLHTDAVQAFQYLDCDVNNPSAGGGVDFMTLSAHKIYGPKGIGALYIRSQRSNVKSQKFGGDSIAPIITGGGQEYGLRSGTENTPSIVGFAKAVEINEKLRKSETKRIAALRDYLLRGFKKINSKIIPNGSIKERIPNNLNIYFPGHLTADLLIKLDLAGIAVSPGAACSARVMRPSYVLEAMGLPHQRCVGSLRITLGRQTKREDLNRFLSVLKGII